MPSRSVNASRRALPSGSVIPSAGALCLGVVFLLGLPACFTLDLDGDGEIDLFPPAGYESDYIACDNGLDDDQDGRIDCADSDCLMAGLCSEDIPPLPPLGVENTFELCSNRIDDDLDGQFDCGDRDCQSILELCCSGEFDDALCSDVIDNDGNGFADCRDFSCRNNPYVTVCDAELDCENGRDDDGDRLTDCRDSDCADFPACEERNCSNGIDDDMDDLVDCEDPSCAGTLECPSETDCTNGMDDDGDGSTDCLDTDCYPTPSCTGAEDTLPRCQDGNDNDGNGFIDCADFSCSMSIVMEIFDYCAALSETSLAQCMDGEDNDLNGFTDCDDFSCSTSMDAAVLEYCASVGENSLERCMDGVDNDENGFTDCDDFSCSTSDVTEIADYCRSVGESTFDRCHDRIDNDGNGFTDCGDFSCDLLEVFYDIGACSDSSECPAITAMGRRGGQTCYDGQCLYLRAPCSEGVSLNADSDVQIVDGGIRIPMPETTLDEQREMAVRGCTDGIDNDEDGFTDCEDWECNHNPLVVDPEGTPICRFAGGRTCVYGTRAGMACGTDEDCAGFAGACGRSGPAGVAFVCPG